MADWEQLQSDQAEVGEVRIIHHRLRSSRRSSSDSTRCCHHFRTADELAGPLFNAVVIPEVGDEYAHRQEGHRHRRHRRRIEGGEITLVAVGDAKDQPLPSPWPRRLLRLQPPLHGGIRAPLPWRWRRIRPIRSPEERSWRRVCSDTAEDHPRASASSSKVSRSPSRARLAAPQPPSSRAGMTATPGRNAVAIALRERGAGKRERERM